MKLSRFVLLAVFLAGAAWAEERFPANSIFYAPIDTLPVSPDNATIMPWAHTGNPLHPDFGTTYLGQLNGIPINYVNNSTPRKIVTYVPNSYDYESDPMPPLGLPIPDNVIVEGDPQPWLTTTGTDHHMILVDTDTHLLHELFLVQPNGNTWKTMQYSQWDMTSNALRTDTWTSADAAGMPIYPFLVKYDEAASGTISHALRFTLSNVWSYKWPARHAGYSGALQGPYYGMRVRMKASVDTTRYPAVCGGGTLAISAINQTILRAMKKYGMFLADAGGEWFVSGEPDIRWDSNDLSLLVCFQQDMSQYFEIVDESSLMVGPNSAAAAVFTLGVTVPAGGTTNVDAWAPSLILPIPAQQTNVGQTVTMDLGHNLRCAPYFGSPVNNCVWSWVVAPQAPSTSSISANGVLTATIMGNQPNLQLRVTSSFGGGTSAVSNVFNWNVNGAPPLGVVATGKFVDCSSATNGSGTQASPWNRLSSVTGMTTGTDLWLKAGTTCTNQMLTVNWGGTAVDRVVIGSYYVSSGVAYQLTPTVLLANPMDAVYANGARAIIRGSYQPSCRVWTGGPTTACLFEVAGAVPGPSPGGRNIGLIDVVNVSYVTIQDLEARDSAGSGIHYDGQAAPNWCYTNTPNCDDYIIIQRNKVSHVASAGILAQETHYLVIRENEVEFINLAWLDSKFGGNFWSSGINTIRSAPLYGLIENNYVHDLGQGEGIGPYTTGHVLVRGNRMANRVLIYLDGDNDVVSEQNIVAGGNATIEAGLGNPALVASNAGDGSTVTSFTKEPPATSNGSTPLAARRHVVRNNLGANTSGFQFGIDSSAGATQIDGIVAGNTTVGGLNSSQLRINDSGVPASSIGPLGLKAQNNIFASTSGYANCYASISPGLAGITTDYNFWTGTPVGQLPSGAGPLGCMSPGTHDIHSTFAALAFNSGYTHFGDASKTTFPAYTDFQVQAGSSVANAGVAMTNALLINGEWTWVLAQRQWMPACQSTQVPESEFVKALTTDYCGAPRTTPFMGALKPL